MRKIKSSDRCSRRNECPKCQGTKWCLILEDRILCMKVESERPAKSGEGWWHPLPGEEWPEYQPGERVEREPGPEPTKRAGLVKRDRVYSDLLKALPLTEVHWKHLLGPKRQLTEKQVESRQYRTLYTDGGPEEQEHAAEYFATQLSRHGDLHKIPGFGTRAAWRDQEGEAKLRGALCLSPRVLIPVRSIEGMIEGFQMMEPAPKSKDVPKYIWFSGVGDDGAGIGTPLHVSRPTETTEARAEVIITEGPLKADIISDRTGCTTVAFQGVNCIDWDALKVIIEKLSPERLLLAIDMDRLETDKPVNDHVAKAHEQLCNWCEEHGFSYLVGTWDYKQGKGLDDLLLAGGKADWGFRARASEDIPPPSDDDAPVEPEDDKSEVQRRELERLVLTSSWSDPGKVREITRYENSAWRFKLHRACLDALRRLVQDGDDLNTRSIRRDLKAYSSEFLPEFDVLESWYKKNRKGLAGLRNTALSEFIEEYRWEGGGIVLDLALETFRQGRFEDWHGRFSNQLNSVAPGADQVAGVKRFSQILLEGAEQLENPELSEESKPVSTGIPELDEALNGGFFRGDNVLIVGAPGHGKTTGAFQIATNMSMNGVESYFQSLEMKRLKMVKRVIAQASNTDLKKIGRKAIQIAKMNASAYKNIHFDDRFCKVKDYIPRLAAYLHGHQQIFCVLSDHSGSLQEQGSDHGAHQEANKVAANWYQAAKGMNICAIMLQQPNNRYKDAGVPKLQFIRNTGLFEEYADVILWWHHPWRFDKSKDPRIMEVWVMKNREGEIGLKILLDWRRAQFCMKAWEGERPKGYRTPKREDVDNTSVSGEQQELPEADYTI